MYVEVANRSSVSKFCYSRLFLFSFFFFEVGWVEWGRGVWFLIWEEARVSGWNNFHAPSYIYVRFEFVNRVDG